MQNRNNHIFLGLKISAKIREQLDSCKTSMKPYFANNNPEFLQVIQIDSEDYIGKLAESGASLEDLSNNLMNLKTMLQMICPDFSFSNHAVKIFAYSLVQTKTYY